MLTERIRSITSTTTLTLLLVFCASCTTLKPPNPITLPGAAANPIEKLSASLFTRATMDDEVFDGQSVESIDAADLANGIVSADLAERIAGLSAVTGELISKNIIEPVGTRVWHVRVTGDNDGDGRWFFVRPVVNGASEISTLAPGQLIRVYAERVEVGGVSALVLHRWGRR